MNRSPGRRGNESSLARAMYWGSRASSAAMQFVVPPAIGILVDWKYATTPVGVVVGGVLGFICGLRQVIHLVNKMDEASRDSSDRD